MWLIVCKEYQHATLELECSESNKEILRLIDLKLGAQGKKLALSLVDGALYGPGACPLNRSLDTKFYFPHS